NIPATARKQLFQLSLPLLASRWRCLGPQENSFFNGHYRYLPVDGVVNNNDLIALRRTDKSANVATDLVRYQRNERERVKIAGTRTQRTADLSLQYLRLAFRYNPAVQVDMLSLDR
ncbi:hypothetical protein AVEN_238232-1, partial [Araneus ventricosus]